MLMCMCWCLVSLLIWMCLIDFDCEVDGLLSELDVDADVFCLIPIFMWMSFCLISILMWICLLFDF